METKGVDYDRHRPNVSVHKDPKKTSRFGLYKHHHLIWMQVTSKFLLTKSIRAVPELKVTVYSRDTSY